MASRKDDKVGLYCRNRIEIVIAMLGNHQGGRNPGQRNFRYVEGELRYYLFENSDMVALVHTNASTPTGSPTCCPRRRTSRRSSWSRTVPTSTTCALWRRRVYEAIADGSSPERDFGERSEDDIYLLYTGGTTGFPKA